MTRANAVGAVRAGALLMVCAVGGRILACEDEHPPIVTTPAESFVLRRPAGVHILALAFDPRGVGSVVPQGDVATQWIDLDDSTGAWHYREWQWWKGHPWGDSCRPRFYADVTFRAMHDAPRGAIISYRIDGFGCRQFFYVPEVEDEDAPQWEIVTSIKNASGRDVEEYGQFFACYTPLNRGRSFWYWDESNELVTFADRGVGHLDGYVANPRAYFLETGAVPHCPRGGGKIVGRWRRPVMVSQASPAGWRSIILIEAEHAAALAQGIEGGAMDYTLFPDEKSRAFANGTEFSVHIRHVMLKSSKLPAIERLEKLWADFERSHAANRGRAARL